MTQKRQGVFDTGGCTTHALTMCMESDFNKWKGGELIYNREENMLVPCTVEINEIKESGEGTEYMTYDDFTDWSYMPYETFEREFTTRDGEKVISFGYFGYDEG